MKKVAKILTFILMFIIVLDFKLPVNAVEMSKFSSNKMGSCFVASSNNLEKQLRKGGKDVVRTSNGAYGKILSIKNGIKNGTVKFAFFNPGIKIQVVVHQYGSSSLFCTLPKKNHKIIYKRYFLEKNKLYSYQIRGGVGRNYSEWSNSVYFATVDYEITQIGNRKRFKIKTPKVAGIKNYKIYMSLKKNGGWKKIKTVTAGKEVIISKFKGKALKKKQNYYYKIIPNKGSFHIGGMRFR